MKNNDLLSDIENMTGAHLKNVQQLALFRQGNGSLNSINISKVKAFIIAEDINIIPIPTEIKSIIGIGTIREEPITIVNLDIWLGFKPLENIKDYKIILYCEYNNKQIGFLVREVVNIVEKNTEDLKKDTNVSNKITYMTYANLNGKEELVLVFNAEQLLEDLGFETSSKENINSQIKEQKLNSKKTILVAEDSETPRRIIKTVMETLNAKYEMFEDGRGVIKRLQERSDDVGLVFSDVEMPHMDGYQVATYVKQNHKNIPVLINTSMTGEGIVQKMKKIGVDDFIGKTNVPLMVEAIKRNMDKKEV